MRGKSQKRRTAGKKSPPGRRRGKAETNVFLILPQKAGKHNLPSRKPRIFLKGRRGSRNFFGKKNENVLRCQGFWPIIIAESSRSNTERRVSFGKKAHPAGDQRRCLRPYHTGKRRVHAVSGRRGGRLDERDPGGLTLYYQGGSGADCGAQLL